MIAIRDLEMTKERLLSFAEYAKDAQPEVLVTLIQTIVERIYIVDKDDERFCHIFIKGCSGEDYTGFFRTAGYIEQKTTPVCDSEQYCIIVVLFVLVILFLVIAFIPIYKLILQSRVSIANNENDRMDLTIKREALIIEVITKNTEVISGLKLLFENTLNPSLKEMESKISELCNKIDELDKK